MSFDWKDYHSLANELYGGQGNSSDEAANRSAISRAYYAAFHEALQHAPARISKSKSGSKHQQLIRHYKAGDKRERQVGRFLETLRDNRNAADYDSDIGGPRQCAFKAQHSLHLTDQVYNTLSEMHG